MIRVAICTAPEDKAHLERLEKLLANAEKSAQIEVWHRGRIPVGDDIEAAVRRALSGAQVIVVLLSSDLRAAYDGDLALAVAQQARGATIVPVSLRPCMPDPRFSRMRMLPDSTQPISGLNKADAETAWVTVAQTILGAAEPNADQPPVPAQRPDQGGADAQQRTPKLLFLAANPSEATRLALDREVREIDNVILREQQRDRLVLVQKWAVALDDLPGIVMGQQPTILHFSGHGTTSGRIVLLKSDGTGAPVPPAALTRLLKLAKGLRCVVLNACYAEDQARAISSHVPCVVGISGTIGNEGAIAFSKGFYTGLAQGHTVAEAFELGLVQMDFAEQPKADALRLFCPTATTLRLL